MADKYTIDFTDQIDFTDPTKKTRSFIVTPFSVNGPVSPTSGVLDPMATSASTSLRLVGKGLPEYGERVLENLVHLLEHFAGDKEPTYPINGQVWFNKQVIPQQLCVYNSQYSVLRPSAAHPADVSWYYVDNDQVARLSALQKIRIINGTTGVQEEYTISDVSLKLAATPENSASINRTEFKISPAPSTSRANAWYIGGWEYILQNNAPLRADFNANNYRIINLSMSNPGAPTDAVNRVYVDTAVSNLDGKITAIINGETLSLGRSLKDVNLGITDINPDPIPPPLTPGPVDKNEVILYYNYDMHAWMAKHVDQAGALISTKDQQTLEGNLTINGTVETGTLTINGGIAQSGGDISFQGDSIGLQGDSISLQSATTIDVQGDVNIDGDMMFVSGSKIILPGTVGSFTQDDQVVNKLYVDAAVGSASTSLTLNTLADVTINSSNNDDFLMFDLTTSEWVNRDKTYVAAAFTGEFVPISGGTMSGILILSAHPTAASPSLQAATKGYVDSAIANVSVGGGGTTGGVTGGEYIPDQDLLILHQGAEFVFPVLVVDHINDSFEVDDNFVLVFSEGSTFDVQCSTSASYTVGPTGAVYDVGTNTTIIPVTTAVPSGMPLSSCEINAIPLAGADDINNTFTLLGDHAVDFALGTSFNTICWNTSSSTYTVEAPGASFNSGVDRTVIPVVEDVPAGMLTAGPCRITGTGYGASDVYISMDMGGTTALKTYDVNHPVVGYDQYATDYQSNVWETTLLQNLISSGASREISLRTIVEEFSTLFGAFAEPKFRQIVSTTGSATYTLSNSYPVGTNDLSVFVNGVKQIASERAERIVTGTTKKWPSMDTGLSNTQSYGFRIRLNGAGSDTDIKFGGELGEKYYKVIETLNNIGNATSVLSVQIYDPDTNTIILTGNKAYLFPAAKTFVLESDGPPLTQVTLTVTGAGATYDTGTQTTRIPVTTDLQPTVLKVGVTTYPIVAKSDTLKTFTVSGNQTSVFTVGLVFIATCSTTPLYSTNYTVLSAPTFDGTNTTIPVTEAVYSYGYALTECRINYTGLGFGVTMSSTGGLRFVSDLAGSGSDVILTDGGVSGALNLFATLFTTPTYSGTGSITTDYGYKEVGSIGKTSNTFEFHAASTPPVGSVIEIIVDRRVIR